MISNKKYWQNRSEKRMATYHKNSDETIFKINKAYDKAIKDINEDINNIFRNYQINTGLSASECRKILNSKISNKELISIKERIKYIKDDDIKKQLYAELNSKAYKARITRLEALKDSININTKRVADTELQATTKLYTNNIQDAYYRTLFDIQKGINVGFDVASMSNEQIQEILKNNWSGEHYSKRIWNNSKVFASKLEDTLLSGMMAGHSIQRIAKELEQYTNYGKFATERLARTEMTYMCNMAEIESYKECGIDKYIFLATLDLRTSKQCRQHDGKVYKVSEAKPGVNLPPLHAYCRSTTIADMDSEGLDNLSRRARDPITGKTYIVPGDMNYEEWYQKYVVNKYGENKSQAMENMIKNKSYDKAQLKKYKKVLGKESPKSLKEFQELKYNNNIEWSELKAQYRKLNYYDKVIKNEPKITTDLTDIANNTGTELVGLDFRLKSKESYLRKVNTDSNHSLDFKVIKDTIEDTKDIIRYTYQTSDKELVDKYKKINNELINKGYEQIKLKNYWINKTSAYKGINCNYIAPNGQKFEIQFHTPESFNLKNNELHKLYEEFRLDITSDERKVELTSEMFKLSSKLVRPLGIETVK